MKLWAPLACAYVFAECLAAQPVVIGMRQASSPTGNGLIEGTVVNEITQEPVKKAQVTLSANAGPVVTDGTGRFVFRNLAPGVYWLQAWHPLFPQATGAIARRPLNVTLGPDEQKRDLVIALTPGATISGSIFDEDRKPLAGCNVQAMEFQPGQPERRLSGRSSAVSDSRGQYRLYGLPSGRYYLMVQCQTLPAPHPLMRAGPDVDLPQQRYTPEFYPGPPDASGAGRLVLAAGADLRGIDFQVQATQTVTLRGRFSGDLEALRHNPWVQLIAHDPLMDNIIQYGGTVDIRRGTFRIEAVPPGIYTLVGVALDEARAYQAKIPINIGSEAPAPIDMAFLAGSTFIGSVQAASDQPQTPNAIQVRLIPLDFPAYGQGPYSKLEKDGTFTLSGVMPGRWRLQLENATGYVKSFMLGDQPASPYGFTVGPGAGGVMRIVMGAKFAQIGGVLTGAKSENADNVWLMSVPDDPDRIAAGQISIMPIGADGHFTMVGGIEPGKYRLYGSAGVEPWAIQQHLGVLKAIENWGVQIDAEEGAQLTVEVPAIPIEELLQAIREQE